MGNINDEIDMDKAGFLAIKIRMAMMCTSLFLNLGLSVLLPLVILGAFKFDWDEIVFGMFLVVVIGIVIHFALKPIIAILFRFLEVPIMGIAATLFCKRK